MVVVLPWNLESEITAQLRHIGEWGGRLVYPMPTVRVVDPNAVGSDVVEVVPA